MKFTVATWQALEDYPFHCHRLDNLWETLKSPQKNPQKAPKKVLKKVLAAPRQTLEHLWFN